MYLWLQDKLFPQAVEYLQKVFSVRQRVGLLLLSRYHSKVPPFLLYDFRSFLPVPHFLSLTCTLVVQQLYSQRVPDARTSAFRVASGEISQHSSVFYGGTPPFGRDPESRVSEANRNKDGCTRKEINFLCICTTSVILMLIFKCSHTLDYIAAIIQSSMCALHGLAVRAIQCKVGCFQAGLLKRLM